MKPKALIFSGYGLNSEEETAYGFEIAGAKADIIHINDIVGGLKKLENYQIISFPGGFSYGDDTGAGNAYANKIKNHLWEHIQKFVSHDKLVIGICNGCQIVTNLGLIPAFHKNYGRREAVLSYNRQARFTTRWTDLKVENNTPWLAGIDQLSLPVAHGEGNFYVDDKNLNTLKIKRQIALTYVSGTICSYLDLPANPNGSLADIAGITDPTGKILGLMPHPERGMFFIQRPDNQLLKEKYLRNDQKIPEYAEGLQIFKNAVQYFS